ncbi:hypothetical protein SARU107417_13725 [Salinibacter ruber]
MSTAAPATLAAPSIAATVPVTDTAPEVPAATRRPVRSDHGAVEKRVPTSVAHVSAAAAARAPTKTA